MTSKCCMWWENDKSFLHMSLSVHYRHQDLWCIPYTCASSHEVAVVAITMLRFAICRYRWSAHLLTWLRMSILRFDGIVNLSMI